MAKIKSPLHSLAATGALARTIIYQTGPHGATAKHWKAPGYRRSPAQDAVRLSYRAAITAWHALTSGERLAYNASAIPLSITGYNLWLREQLAAAPALGGTIWDGGATAWDGGSTIWD